ncbi:hypothetical protein EON81_17505 [bacterium]|nr:MAG: hypothetical protein EON81_17505 [bacterium]
MMRTASTLALSLGLMALALPKMMAPMEVPVERILKTAKDEVNRNPNDPEALYALGRIRFSIYCSTDPRAIRMYSEKPPFRFATNHPASWEIEGAKLKSDPATLTLLHGAFDNLKKAVRLDGGREPGLYALTLACLYEATAPIATKLDRKSSRSIFLNEAYRRYASAFAKAGKLDLDQTYAQKSMTYEKWISVEAAEAMLRLRPSQDKAQIEAHLAKVKEKPSGPITPIVFSLASDTGLEALLDRSKRTDFDLDGTGTAQDHPWVRPETAILVWQPDPSVPITSGRQLFGSATWWMMYRDGYAALSALDNDRNGWLEGKELVGLAVWRDANQNGISETGEVVTVGAAGIRGLATRSEGRTGRSLVRQDGVRFADGRELPTYDWVIGSGE